MKDSIVRCSSIIVGAVLFLVVSMFLLQGQAIGGDLSQLEEHFQARGISFDYPKDWVSWQKNSFNRMRSFMKSRGIDLLVLLKSRDESCVFEIVKSRNPSSFDTLYREKKKFADQVTAEGIEIMGERYVKYSITAVDLADDQKAVLAHAEKPNGAVGISYQLLSDGYEYDVNFIYTSESVAAKDETLREKLMRTFRIARSNK